MMGVSKDDSATTFKTEKSENASPDKLPSIKTRKSKELTMYADF